MLVPGPEGLWGFPASSVLYKTKAEADTSTATSVESCESALRLLKAGEMLRRARQCWCRTSVQDCVPTLKDQIVAAKQQPGPQARTTQQSSPAKICLSGSHGPSSHRFQADFLPPDHRQSGCRFSGLLQCSGMAPTVSSFAGTIALLRLGQIIQNGLASPQADCDCDGELRLLTN